MGIAKHMKNFGSHIYPLADKYLHLTKRSLKYEITVFVIMLVLFPMIFTGAYLYYNMSSILKESAKNYLVKYLNDITSEVERQFGIIDNTSLLVLGNPAIKKDLETPTGDSQYLKTKIRLDMESQLKSLLFLNTAWDNKLLNSVFIFKDQETFYYISRFLIITAEDSIIKDNIKVYTDHSKDSRDMWFISPTAGDKTIYFVRTIKDLNTLKPLGKLILGLDESQLTTVKKSNPDYNDMQFMIFDNKGTILSGSNNNVLLNKNKMFLDVPSSDQPLEISVSGKEYFAVVREINIYNLKTVVVVPKEQVFLNLKESMNQYTAMVCIIIILFIFIGLFISDRVTKPIKEIAGIIEKIKNREFKTRMPVYSYTELNNLSAVINQMTDEIEHLICQVFEEQILLKESELKSLQAQINPHFLFNTLETISWEARITENDKIYKMITSLGQFIRASISMTGREKITVREELQYIEFYLYLQKMRFEDRLRTHISIRDDFIYELYLPKLCVQSIVENAVIHGLENKRGEGFLKINICIQNDTVIFEVEDNGVGFRSSEINLDHFQSAAIESGEHKSLGLYNSNKRIKLLYGEQYGIHIESELGKGTKVLVTIPVDRSGNECIG